MRWEKLDDCRKEKIWNGYDVDLTTTQEELDYGLKVNLRIPPEQRYQQEKQDIYFHEKTKLTQIDGVDYINEYGCDSFTGCIPECRFYPEYGRIEDEEVIQEHKEIEERLRKENNIVERAHH